RQCGTLCSNFRRKASPPGKSSNRRTRTVPTPVPSRGRMKRVSKNSASLKSAIFPPKLWQNIAALEGQTGVNLARSRFFRHSHENGNLETSRFLHLPLDPAFAGVTKSYGGKSI